MRIALISDIHGQRVALDAVLADIAEAGADRIVCLGDAAALGPEPKACVARLRDLGCACVMGNADAALFEPPDPPGDERMAKIADLFDWCRDQLDDDDIALLKSFRPSLTAGWILCCHGSPRSFDDVIEADTDDTALAAFLDGVEQPWGAGGHTHRKLLRRLGTRTFVRPGSAGMPFTVDPATGARTCRWHGEYALATEDGVEFRRVAIDRDAALAAVRAADMPHRDWWLGWWERA